MTISKGIPNKCVCIFKNTKLVKLIDTEKTIAKTKFSGDSDSLKKEEDLLVRNTFGKDLA